MPVNPEPRYDLETPEDLDYLGAFAGATDADREAWGAARTYGREILPRMNEAWQKAEYPLDLVAKMGEADLLTDIEPEVTPVPEDTASRAPLFKTPERKRRRATRTGCSCAGPVAEDAQLPLASQPWQPPEGCSVRSMRSPARAEPARRARRPRLRPRSPAASKRPMRAQEMARFIGTRMRTGMTWNCRPRGSVMYMPSGCLLASTAT
mgnify:CR=1 FL=1